MPPSTSPVVLEFQGVSCAFGGVMAVQDLSFTIDTGEIVCLLGGSGCGKTTSLRLAAGFESPASGRILKQGSIIADGYFSTPPQDRSLGFIFQDYALFPHLTVLQNVMFGLHKMSKVAQSAQSMACLERVGMAGHATKYPHQLSGGEQQRVALARALAPCPHLVLMDEPFSSLDKRLRDHVRDETIGLLRQEGGSAILVTHEPEEAMLVADRVVLMRAGQIVQMGAPWHICNHPIDRQAAAFFSDINSLQSVVYNLQCDTPFGLFLTPSFADGTAVEIVIRPQHLDLELDHGQPSPPSSLKNGIAARGRVVDARFLGALSVITIAMDYDNSLLRASVPGLFLPDQGQALWVSLRRDYCFVFPA